MEGWSKGGGRCATGDIHETDTAQPLGSLEWLWGAHHGFLTHCPGVGAFEALNGPRGRGAG